MGNHTDVQALMGRAMGVLQFGGRFEVICQKLFDMFMFKEGDKIEQDLTTTR